MRQDTGDQKIEVGRGGSIVQKTGAQGEAAGDPGVGQKKQRQGPNFQGKLENRIYGGWVVCNFCHGERIARIEVN